jgi:hypothetical protein
MWQGPIRLSVRLAPLGFLKRVRKFDSLPGHFVKGT